VHAEARAISLIKGFHSQPDGSFELVTDLITSSLGVARCACLMGANLAGEIARGEFCESTIGCAGGELEWEIFRKLFEVR